MSKTRRESLGLHPLAFKPKEGRTPLTKNTSPKPEIYSQAHTKKILKINHKKRKDF